VRREVGRYIWDGKFSSPLGITVGVLSFAVIGIGWLMLSGLIGLGLNLYYFDSPPYPREELYWRITLGQFISVAPPLLGAGIAWLIARNFSGKRAGHIALAISLVIWVGLILTGVFWGSLFRYNPA